MGEVNKKHVRNGKMNWIKFGIWLPWMMAILAGFMTMGINEFNFLFATESGISVDRPARYILYFGVVGIFVIVNLLVGKRAMCHYGCWMSPFMIIGISIRKVLHLPGLTLTAEKEKCISCNKCSKVCPMSLDVLSMVQEDNMTNLECVLCTRCEEACPKAVIDLKFAK